MNRELWENRALWVTYNLIADNVLVANSPDYTVVQLYDAVRF